MSGQNTEESAIELQTASEAETHQIAADIAAVMQIGDLIGLSGDLGAGKSVFCRGVIRHLSGDAELEVPSPSYTLCNEYDCVPKVAHYDLYRLGSHEELAELGLEDALEDGCALIEWPENGFENFPEDAVLITFEQLNDNTRLLRFTGSPEVLRRIDRSFQIRKFLNNSQLERAIRVPMAADASARRYELINGNTSQPWLLMDSPEMPDGPPVRDGKPYSRIAHLAENVTAFVAVGSYLNSKNFGGPEIPAYDLEQGFVLIEHMGDGKITDTKDKPIEDRYLLSVEYLANLHVEGYAMDANIGQDLTYTIPEYDLDAMMIEAELLLDWYVPAVSKRAVSDHEAFEFRRIWSDLFQQLSIQEKRIVLRDYHSPNIIWRAEKQGLEQIGVIDYQDALMGPSAYDVASLIQDARIDIPDSFQSRLLDHYITCRHHNNATFDGDTFRAGVAIMAAQRATKILGIFIRLDRRDGKPHYLQHLPRIERYLAKSLEHPILSSYREWIRNVIEL